MVLLLDFLLLPFLPWVGCHHGRFTVQTTWPKESHTTKRSHWVVCAHGYIVLDSSGPQTGSATKGHCRGHAPPGCCSGVLFLSWIVPRSVKGRPANGCFFFGEGRLYRNDHELHCSCSCYSSKKKGGGGQFSPKQPQHPLITAPIRV